MMRSISEKSEYPVLTFVSAQGILNLRLKFQVWGSRWYVVDWDSLGVVQVFKMDFKRKSISFSRFKVSSEKSGVYRMNDDEVYQ